MSTAGDRNYYVIDGKRVPRVTSIIQRTLAKPMLVGWAYRPTRDVISGLVSTIMEIDRLYAYQLIEMLDDGDMLEEYLKENRLRPDDVMEEAGDIGTENHAAFERLARINMQWGITATVQAAREYSLSPDGHARAIGQWFLDRKPRIVASEIQLHSKKHNYAGTCDAVYIDQHGDGARVITDLKNRAADLPCAVNHKTEAAAERCHVKGGPYESDEVQVGAYEIAWDEEHPGEEVDRRTVFVAQADGRYREKEAEIPSASFIDLVSLDQKLHPEQWKEEDDDTRPR